VVALPDSTSSSATCIFDPKFRVARQHAYLLAEVDKLILQMSGGGA